MQSAACNKSKCRSPATFPFRALFLRTWLVGVLYLDTCTQAAKSVYRWSVLMHWVTHHTKFLPNKVRSLASSVLGDSPFYAMVLLIFVYIIRRHVHPRCAPDICRCLPHTHAHKRLLKYKNMLDVSKNIAAICLLAVIYIQLWEVCLLFGFEAFASFKFPSPFLAAHKY